MPEVSLESTYAEIADPVIMRGNLHVHTVRVGHRGRPGTRGAVALLRELRPLRRRPYTTRRLDMGFLQI